MAHEVIIGLDFGNCNTFPCFLTDWNGETTRTGGHMHDLLPPRQQDGIPSVYFYSERRGELCGKSASEANPPDHRQRNLKRRLDETVTLDGKTISCADMITRVAQHCVRSANQKLQRDFQLTTNQVSLSYPAKYTVAQRQRLIELVEKGTLEDGRHIKVCGTIPEPAAAALDYLADSAHSDAETTVITYDLGGGTFDLALVAAYPKGRKNLEGKTYYYDALDSGGGLADVGGTEFDEIMYELLLSKFEAAIGGKLNDLYKSKVRRMAEAQKIELSSVACIEPELEYNDDYVSCQVTREEFESKALGLVMQTIEETKRFLDGHAQKPDIILLTGGASQMPMIQEKLREALPQYKDKIIFFRPSKAIAYGAARYGVDEQAMTLRTDYDLGIRFLDEDTGIPFIDIYIPAGTEIPFSGKYSTSKTHNDWQYSSEYHVFEAKVAEPDRKRIDRDWKEIMEVELEHGRVPKGTKCESRLGINKLGVLTVEARDPSKPGKPPVKNTVELKNLS